MANIPRSRTIAAAFAVLLLAIAAAPQPARAQAAKPLQVQETGVEGVNAELVEAVRKDGVLTIKVRYRNTGAQPVKIALTNEWREVDNFYVVAGNTKFLILKDTNKVPVMSTLNNFGALRPDLKPAGSFLFWAKYPAPPAEVKKVNLHTPHGPPFEDVPIAEAK